MFISTHYAGIGLALEFTNQEYWKKVLGPVYVYLNTHPSATTNPSLLWHDAKERMQNEVSSWPYNFPLSEDFAKAKKRGAVRGQLLVHDRIFDRFVNKHIGPGALAHVGLALPGPAGSWQLESKGYQFWTRTDRNGNFLIKDVIPGTYNLFAWIPGVFGDYKYASNIIISPGSNLEAKNVVFDVPRKGFTLWEIGIPDRSAAEFFIPDPEPKFKIHNYTTGKIEKFRQYGIWNRYKDIYPKTDLVYTIGKSDYRKDWFYAHVTRDMGNGLYAATTWQIIFDLRYVKRRANYTLQLALASANNAELQVHVNNLNSPPHFTTGLVGKDNAVARHGIHGVYHSYSIGIAGNQLIVGKNTIYLKQTKNEGRFSDVMYDYIRFESPAP